VLALQPESHTFGRATADAWLRTVCTLVLCCAVAPNAHSADPDSAVTVDDSSANGFYLSAGYAMVYAPDEHLRFTNTTGQGRALLDYDLGFRSASLAAGYRFNNGWRAELEAAYRRNELELIEFPAPTGLLNTGQKDAVDAFTGFANLYREFAIKRSWTPYLGAGIGVGSIGYKGNASVFQNFAYNESPLFDERDEALVWQVIAGLSLPLTSRTRLSAEYRYLASGALTFTAVANNIRTTYKTRHKLHMAGLQLKILI